MARRARPIRHVPMECDGTASAICARQVSKLFDRQVAVDRVTFDIPPGSIFGFIGPSGSGKTTTIRLLTGVYPPTSGDIAVLGQTPVRFTRAVRGQIGYMPQHFVLYPALTVWDNLSFAASLYGMSAGRRERLNELLDFVELGEHRGKSADNISGGMQRRLSLAATLVHDPELLFLDEPTAGVDPILRTKFWGRFRELSQAHATLFVTTQYVAEATYCDLVGVMSNGRLITVDTPEGLRHRAFGGDLVDLRTTRELDSATLLQIAHMEYVREAPHVTSPTSVRLVVDDAKTTVPPLLEWCRQQGVPVESVEEYLPPFDDVFVELVQRAEADHA